MRIIFMTLFLASCGLGGKHEPKPVDKQADLGDKADAWRSSLTPSGGMLYENPVDCDYTLWSGMAKAAGVAIDMDLVESAPGHIQRRPGEPCWHDNADHGSKSEISNDQLSGYLAARYRSGDLPALQRLADYASAHSYVMGAPAAAIGDVVMKEPLRVLMHRMIYALSAGKDDRTYRGILPDYEPVSEDYARHIQTLQIALQGEVFGSISDGMLARLHSTVSDGPLGSAALAIYTGGYGTAIDELLADGPCPDYVRGERPDIFCKIEKLFAADLILRQQKR